MHSRRALMAGAVGLTASLAGCTDVIGGGNDVLLDISASNLTDEDQTAQIVIQDDSDEVIYSEEFELEVSDEEISLLLEGVITAPDGTEFNARVMLPDHATEETYSFSLDCPEETAEGGVTSNDRVTIIVRSTDEIDFSHNGCA